MHASTPKHLSYARGYLDLGMLNEASDEIEGIAFTDRLLPEVLLVRLELALAAKHWDLIENMTAVIIETKPDAERAWILRAIAAKARGRVADSKAVLLTAESAHGHGSPVLHYNLACYHCLLGELDAAKERLARACKEHPPFKAEALDDPDLAALWDSWNLPAE